MGTAVDRASAVSEIRQKAEGFGMPNSRVDGMDVIQIYEAAKATLEKVRTGGPYFLEALTYRYRGHSMGDPERYRESDEIEKWQKDDPIGVFRRRLIESEGISSDELDAQEAQAEAAIEESIQFAESSPDPDPATLYDYVYVE
jgi:pyruvate dehydrogenase E1 component alpha subunit